MTTKIIINVHGWMVQDVISTDSDIEVTILDWDNIDNKDGSPELELVEEGSYPVYVVTEQEIKDRVAEANEHIQNNIENEVE